MRAQQLSFSALGLAARLGLILLALAFLWVAIFLALR